jgi:YidC/Oxa1 family membrane protein insertase
MTTALRSLARRLPAARALPAVLLLVGLPLLIAACGGAPGGSGSPGVTPTPAGAIALQPAHLSADPVSLFAWLFTPIFQAMFIVLVLLDRAVGNIPIAIILLTLLLRIILVPIFRAQTVNTKRMQLVQPEVKELQRKHKGDRVKQQAVVAEFYRQRGINPASGCLPLLLTFGLLIPVYSVISQGLQNYDVNGMLNVFGWQILRLDCDPAPVFNALGHVANPCLKPIAFGHDWSQPDITFSLLPGILGATGFGVSILAIISALFQFVQSRMTLPPTDPNSPNDDPNIRVQRQMAYFLPFISILWGTILPSGLFLYWIFGTMLAIVQQYLIIGWGGTFPIFGWTPGFARDHKPRFPVPPPTIKPLTDDTGKPTAAPRSVDRETSAQRTIRPTKQQRGGRRGRRR